MKEDSGTNLFIEQARDTFNQSVDALDGETLSRITRARYRALEQTPEHKPARVVWLPAGVLATVCLAMLVNVLVPQTTFEEKTFIDELEIISDLDLYENLEFYEWLEQHEIPS